jgi:DNA-binding transcriptional LysR family regulator
MELRQLKYFVAVAEELHFRRAAEKLHVAQPAVSEQIRKLEVELGVALFDRTPRTVVLTAAGTGMLVDARRILSASDAAAQWARASRRTPGERLRIGHTAFGVPACVSAALGRMRVGGRPAHIELVAGDARALLADVRADRLDAAVVHLPGPTAGLNAFSLGDQLEAMVAVPRDSRLAEGPISLTALGRAPLSVMARAVDPAFYDAVIGSLVQAGQVADVVESAATSTDQLLLEVTAGGGAAILPGPAAVRAPAPGVVLRALPEGALAAARGVVSRYEPPSAALDALLDELRRGRRAPAAAERVLAVA